MNKLPILTKQGHIGLVNAVYDPACNIFKHNHYSKATKTKMKSGQYSFSITLAIVCKGK